MELWLILAFCSAVVSSLWSLSVDFGVRSVEPDGFAAWYCLGAALFITMAFALHGGVPKFGSTEALTGLASGASVVLLTSSFAAAPNPGYCMAAFRTQSVLTAIASYFLFKAPLGIRKLIGMVVVIAGVAVLGMAPHMPRANRVKKNSDDKPGKMGIEWLLLALGAGLAMTGKDILSKRLLMKKGPKALRGLILGTGVVQAVAMMVYYVVKSGHFLPQAVPGPTGKAMWGKIGLSAAAFALYQGVITKAVGLAPNAGFVKGIDVLGVILTMFGSYELLGGTVTKDGVIGALIVIAGTVGMIL